MIELNVKEKNADAEQLLSKTEKDMHIALTTQNHVNPIKYSHCFESLNLFGYTSSMGMIIMYKHIGTY